MRVCFMLYFMGSVMVPDIILSYLCRGSQKFPFTPKIVNSSHHPCVRTHECKPVRTRPSFWDHATDNYVLQWASPETGIS
jgi:hypothetical protein